MPRKRKSSLKERSRGVLKGINYKDPVVKYRGSKVLRIARIVANRKIDLSLSFAIDLFYTFYLPMPILEAPTNIPRDKMYNYAIINSLLNSSKIHEIRSKTVVDGLMSSIAASIFISELQELENRKGRGKEGKGSDISSEELKKNIEKAASTVARDLDNIKKLRSLIEGDQPGRVSMIAYEEYGPELIRLARNLEVRKILDLLRGIKPWSISIERRKQRFKHGEIMGYELGRDIERIVPSVLALPDELFYLRLLEGRLLLYQKVLTQGRGSLYVLLDKSGSMDGLKMTWAKAVALSLYMRAVRERREFYMRFFDSIPYPLARVTRKPRVDQVVKLIDYIARVRGSGGTDITRAILTACTDIREGFVGDTNDIVLITDGVDRVAEQIVRHNLRRANARLITVMIMGNNKSLKEVSTKYFSVTKLSQKNILEIVEAS
ncbi:MAG: VWA domain-containing protein [Thermoprotei archaeon]